MQLHGVPVHLVSLLSIDVDLKVSTLPLVWSKSGYGPEIKTPSSEVAIVAAEMEGRIILNLNTNRCCHLHMRLHTCTLSKTMFLSDSQSIRHPSSGKIPVFLTRATRSTLDLEVTMTR